MTNTTILQQIQEDTKDAMRARETDKATALRMLSSSLKNKQIDLRRELTDDDILGVLATEAKKRRESAQAYRDGNRIELAEKEEMELGLIEKYLPKQLTDEEVQQLVVDAIATTGAESKRDMGKVMGIVIPAVKGRYDGSKVKDIVLGKLP